MGLGGKHWLDFLPDQRGLLTALFDIQGDRASVTGSRTTARLFPLATLIWTGRIRLRHTGSLWNHQVLQVEAAPSLFSKPLLPLGCGLPLQMLISTANPDMRELTNMVDHFACPTWDHSGGYFRHAMTSCCTPVSRDAAPEFADMPGALLPCHECYAPVGMRSVLRSALADPEHNKAPELVAETLFQNYSQRHWTVTGRKFDAHNQGLRVEEALEEAKPREIARRGGGLVPGLTVPLRDYQLHAVEWWGKREQDPAAALARSIHFGPSDYTAAGAASFHYCDVTGELSLYQPCGQHGGVLASDMGMGKTVMTLASILTHGPRSRLHPQALSDRGYCHGGTLIIVPPMLFKQWENEIARLAPDLRRSLCLYYGMTRPKDPKLLSKYDVVLTTYHTYSSNKEDTNGPWPWTRAHSVKTRMINGEALTVAQYVARELASGPQPKGASLKRWYELRDKADAGRLTVQEVEEHGALARWFQARFSAEQRFWSAGKSMADEHRASPLRAVHWHRLVLDEAHMCRCYGDDVAALRATNRFLLSGTPFGTAEVASHDSICGQLTALYGTRVRALLRVQTTDELVQLVANCTLRHEKEDKYEDGEALLQLPPKHHINITVRLGRRERGVYDHTLAKLREVIRPHLRFPNWYSFLADGGRRLRQLVSHARNVRGDPFDMSTFDWRRQIQLGHGHAQNAQHRADLGQRFEVVTVAELGQRLRAARCTESLVAHILGHNYAAMPEECPICMEQMSLGTDQNPCCTACGHMACASCLGGVVDSNKGCPLCRHPLTRATVWAIGPDTDDGPAPAAAAAAGGPAPAGAAAAAAGPAPRPGQKRKRPADGPGDHGDDDLGPMPSADDGAAWRAHFDILKERPTSAKLDAVLAEFDTVCADEPGAKFLWFTQFDGTQRALIEELERRGVVYRRIGMGMDVRSRHNALQYFTTEADCLVLLLSIQVGAVGLNLTMASHIFIIDPPNNLTLERQAVGRCHRMGQGREVFVRKFVGEKTIDEVLLTAAQRQGEAGTGAFIAGQGHFRAAVDDADKGKGVALLARRELLECFGFTEDEVYDRERDGGR